MVGTSQQKPHFYDTAGAVWILDETEIDPRYLGAKADYLNFSQQKIAAGSSAQLTFAYQYTPSSLDVGKYFGAVMSGPPSPSWKYLRFVAAPTNGDPIVFGRADQTAQSGTGDGSFVNLYPGCLSTTSAVSSIAWSSGVATVTTTAAHGLLTGDTTNITLINSLPAGYQGTYIGTVTGSTTITYPLASNPGTETTAGTAYLSSFVPGAYTITFSSATAYTVTDPNGLTVGSGSFTAATAGARSIFTSGKLCFTLQQGDVAFVAGRYPHGYCPGCVRCIQYPRD